MRALLPDGVDYAFDAIGRTTTTETAIHLLGLGGSAVVVGIPPEGSSASFDPLLLVELDQRILGSNYGGIRPAVDIPQLVDLVMTGDLRLEEMVSARRPLAEAAAALDELATGAALRQLLIPDDAALPRRRRRSDSDVVGLWQGVRSERRWCRWMVPSGKRCWRGSGRRAP